MLIKRPRCLNLLDGRPTAVSVVPELRFLRLHKSSGSDSSSKDARRLSTPSVRDIELARAPSPPGSPRGSAAPSPVPLIEMQRHLSDAVASGTPPLAPSTQVKRSATANLEKPTLGRNLKQSFSLILPPVGSATGDSARDGSNDAENDAAADEVEKSLSLSVATKQSHAGSHSHDHDHPDDRKLRAELRERLDENRQKRLEIAVLASLEEMRSDEEEDNDSASEEPTFGGAGEGV